MRRTTAMLVSTALAGGLAACDAPPPGPATAVAGPEVTGSLVSMHAVDAVERGIVRQRTIYPHHFVPDTAVLTSLGERDLAVLARHLRRYPGHLNVARGDASEALYEARVSSVRYVLLAEGVGPDAATITDGLPGGAGLRSADARAILERDDADDFPPGDGGDGAMPMDVP